MNKSNEVKIDPVQNGKVLIINKVVHTHEIKTVKEMEIA